MYCYFCGNLVIALDLLLLLPGVTFDLSAGIPPLSSCERRALFISVSLPGDLAVIPQVKDIKINTENRRERERERES